MPEPRRPLRLRDHVLLYLLPGKHRAPYESRSRSPSRRKLLRLLRGERGAPLSIVSAFRKAGIPHSIDRVYKTLDRLHAEGLVVKSHDTEPTLQEVIDLCEAALSSDPREQAKLDDIPVLTYSLTATGRSSARLLLPPRRSRSATAAGGKATHATTVSTPRRQSVRRTKMVDVDTQKTRTSKATKPRRRSSKQSS